MDSYSALVDTPEAYQRVMRQLDATTGPIYVDTETTGLRWQQDHEICGVCIGAGPPQSPRSTYVYLPFRHAEGRNLPLKVLRDLCDRLYQWATLRSLYGMCGHNLKFDLHMLGREDGRFEALPDGSVYDTQLAAHLLNENDRMKLEILAAKYLGESLEDMEAAESALIAKIMERFGVPKSGAKGHMWRLPPEDVAAYGVNDVVLTSRLHRFQLPHLEEWNITKLAREVFDFSLQLQRMEHRGLPLDMAEVDRLEAEAQPHAEALLAEAAADAGYPINLGSPKQVGAWIGTRKTDKDALALLESPEQKRKAQLVLDYRVASKAVGTYYRPIRGMVSADGRLRPNFRMVSAPARLASGEPNTQAMPEYAKTMFRAPEGWWMAELDYSQAEIRLAAHYSQDPELLRVVHDGVNMHDLVSERLGIDRHRAKQINFSAQYGIGPRTFAEKFGVEEAEAREYLEGYYKVFAGNRAFYLRAEREAGARGYIRLWTGRLQRFDGRRSPTYTASNRLIQGGIAEITRVSMQRLDRELPALVQLNQVHDSVVAMVRVGDTATLHRARGIMEDFENFTVRPRVDVKFGPTLGEMEALK